MTPVSRAAAAVAALSLMVGFTVEVVRGDHIFGFYQENSADKAFELTLSAHEITVPNEFVPQNNYSSFTDVDTPPGELFEMFGLTLPINDNFTEIADKTTDLDVSILDENIEVQFNFTLYNKTIGSETDISARYFSNTNKLSYRANRGLLPGEPSEIITLNNGSQCLVTRSLAVFSLDGAHYELRLPYDYDVPDNIDQLPEKEQYKIVEEMIEAMPGIDTVKQVLADLGAI